MFEYIEGKKTELTPAYAVIDVNGIGYFLRISVFTYEKIENLNQIKLYTEFVVREDGHFLFGFHSKEERELFRQLVSVSGIGSNTAVLILSAMNPEQLREAIVEENVNLLKSIKGIGPKTAKRLIVELKDKMLKDFTGEIPETPATSATTFEEAAMALEVLGYPRKITHRVLTQIIKENPSWSVEKIIKSALKRL